MPTRLVENARVLVTGGAGFIGSNLCEALLSQNNEVVCLDDFSTGKYENIKDFSGNTRFKLIEGDIRNLSNCKAAVDGIDFVFHQAALGSVPRSIDDPIATNSVNINGFLNMLLAARDAKVKRFIYATSSSVYGDTTISPKIEGEQGRMLSPYAVTKYVNELYADIIGSLSDIECIGLRYFNVFGKRQDAAGAYAAAIPRFISAFIRHESPTIYGDGNQSRDFTYIGNVVQVNQLAAKTENKDAIGKVYNVAYGANTSVNELVSVLKEMLVEFDPAIRNVEPMNVEERIGDVRDSLASIEKIQTYLGYQPEDDLMSGLKKAISWYWQNLQQKVG